MLNRFFNSKTKTITSAAAILAISGFISRLLGLIREWLLARTFGASQELDIYYAAFRIPDLVYNVLIAGGIIVAFLPLFSESFLKEKKIAWEFTNNVLNIFLFLLIFISFALFIFTPGLIKLIAPGFNSYQKTLTIFLTRIMFLSPIFLGLSSIFSGVLQYFNRFLVYSLCPILYNLGIIFGIIFLSSKLSVTGVAIGVILGAILHLLIQIPSAINCGFRYKVIFNVFEPTVKKVFTLMLPRTFAMAAQQINLVVITAIASTLGEGSISIFNYANNIQYFPIGIIGISFAVAAFPALSQVWANGGRKDFVEKFSSIFSKVLYLIIPLSILMYILRRQIVTVILKHGQFGDLETLLTSSCLGLFSFGLFALVLIPLIFRAFFAIQDTKTPTLIAISAMLLNVVLSFKLTALLKFPNIFKASMINIFSLENIKNISVLGLPLAFSIAAIFQFLLLLIFLYKKIGDFKLKQLLNSFSKILIASILMTISVVFILYLIKPYFNIQTFWGSFSQIIVTGFTGLFVYLLSTWFLRSPEFIRFLRRK